MSNYTFKSYFGRAANIQQRSIEWLTASDDIIAIPNTAKVSKFPFKFQMKLACPEFKQSLRVKKRAGATISSFVLELG